MLVASEVFKSAVENADTAIGVFWSVVAPVFCAVTTISSSPASAPALASAVPADCGAAAMDALTQPAQITNAAPELMFRSERLR